MAKKSIIERELKRKALVNKFEKLRNELLQRLKRTHAFEEKLLINEQIQKLPRNTSRVRIRNRCVETGRARGYFRYFALSRNMLRELGHQGLLTGVTKSSW